MKITPPSPVYVGPAKWKGDNHNKPINRVVIHATAGSEPGQMGAAEGVVRYAKQTTRPSSFHYIADSRHSLQYVYDSTVAYHAPPNSNSLGYELCCSLSNAGRYHWETRDHKLMLRICAKDVARLCGAYDIPIKKRSSIGLLLGRRGICGHSDIRDAWHQTTHWDPGPYFPWLAFIVLVRGEHDALQSGGDGLELAIARLKKRKLQTSAVRQARAFLASMREI